MRVNDGIIISIPRVIAVIMRSELSRPVGTTSVFIDVRSSWEIGEKEAVPSLLRMIARRHVCFRYAVRHEAGERGPAVQSSGPNTYKHVSANVLAQVAAPREPGTWDQEGVKILNTFVTVAMSGGCSLRRELCYKS